MADSLFSSLHISASGMAAQRARMDIVAQNIANAESTRTESGEPYRRRQPIFQAVQNESKFTEIFTSSINQQNLQAVKVAKVVEDPSPFREVYNPSHPDASEKGMVKMPNVNAIEEMVDMQSASRSFEANVSVMEASKRMFMKSLELLR
ncbi:MAG: flagellar basal body rod protein FlgC [Mariprofundaceae bacterium]